ncbi:hypothetical protein ACE1TI_01200 [Alteribacillus sp. JSM 102045]|uniref:hypothetical protein n=1 Tax=Alteribacillus sp. JSM 102045 TaxID=1562101 RepID=UPI0035C26C9B
MLWNRKGNYLLASVLSIGIIGTTPGLTAANQYSTDSIAAKKEVRHDESSFSPSNTANDFNQKSSNPMTTEKSAEYDISIENKNIKEDAQEVKEADTKHYATELGINTEGKDMDTLSEEVREEALKKKAADLGIETNGKDVNELVKEVSLTELTKEAKELGIDPKGKEVQQIMVEIKEKQIQLAAEEIGLETADKSSKEILDEIITEHEEEAKHLDIFPAGKHDVDPLMYE